MSAGSGGHRLPVIDALKVIASQFIVLHHLAFYGPMTDHASVLMPSLVDWFSEHARLAVQVFLVVGGFLAGQRLLPAEQGRAPRRLLAGLLDRYLRLMLPLAMALLLAVAAALIARAWMDHHSVPEAPNVAQLAAHLLLAQDLVGEDALSAGVWYVAIAFQLHAGLLLLLALLETVDARLRGYRRGAMPGSVSSVPWAVALLVVASAFHFNRQSQWDVAAPYFMAAYGLGVLVAWRGTGAAARLAWWSAAALVAATLFIEWRDRLGLALLLAIGLWGCQWASTWRCRAVVAQRLVGHEGDRRGFIARLTSRLAQSSYALFLVHFPVLLLVNAAFTRFVPAQPWPQTVGVVLAWSLSIVAGELFHCWLERPLMKRLDRRGPPADPALAPARG